jgi:hypothetical protein
VTPLTLYLSATAGRWDTGSALPNFLGCATKPHQVRAAYRAADYEKLTAIKAPYDPRNPAQPVSVNHNIPPTLADEMHSIGCCLQAVHVAHVVNKREERLARASSRRAERQAAPLHR